MRELTILLIKALMKCEICGEIGYSDPYVGVESGDDEILRRVHKGYDVKTAREQLEKLKNLGVKLVDLKKENKKAVLIDLVFYFLIIY